MYDRQIKNGIAEQIIDPQEYILRMKWNSSGVYNLNFGFDTPTRPFGYFEKGGKYMIKKIVCVLFIVMLFSGCGNSKVTYFYDDPIISPSGKYMLEILNGYNGIVHYKRFNISSLENKTNPQVIYCSTDTYRTNDKLYFVWDDAEDIVWVYSADMGTFYWSQDSDNNWHKYNKGNKDYPNTLKAFIYNQEESSRD